MNIIEPNAPKITCHKKKLTTIKPSTSPTFKPSTPPINYHSLPISTHYHDEILKSRLTDSDAYYVPPKKIETTTISQTVRDDVKTVYQLECVDERENITLSKSLRIISQTLDYPVSNLIQEGRILIHYNYLQAGCVNNTELYEITTKIESTVSMFTSMIPYISQMSMAIKIISGSLKIISDALDNKELNVDNVIDLNSQILDLSSSIYSSLNTKDMNTLSKNINNKKSENILSPFEYKKK